MDTIQSLTDARVDTMHYLQSDRREIRETDSGHSGHSALYAFYAAALHHNKAVALWQLPGSEEICAVVDLGQVNELTQIDFHRRRAGFVFAPFVTGQQNAAYRIDADAIFTSSGLVLPDTGENPARKAAQQKFAAAYELLAHNSAHLPAPGWYTPSERAPERAAGESEYTHLVRQAATFIRATGIAKVVVSRTTKQPLPAEFDPVATFLELTARYPTAFVSLVSIPGIGTWLGASPEVLLTLDGRRLTTMALAGTQRRPEDRPLAAVRWGAKEITEQEMVSNYVRDFFAGAGVAGLVQEGPQTVAAANIVHLQTLFHVEQPEEELLSLANRVLDELHPTSAVCGMPKHEALAFILSHEGYDRSFYSGFLGPVHLDGCSSLFVNLRCMQLDHSFASLYVGGGITADSEPASEWRETEMKAETMLSVLQNTR